ncbi:MAG: DUF1259 domain-containing protein [Pseudomonadota bacterium]
MGNINYAQASTSTTWQPSEQGVGDIGNLQQGDVFKVWMPRLDLKITVKAQDIAPIFALESWIAFKRIGKESVMRGDLLLTPDEVAPAISSLQNNDIQIIGLHQVLLYESPQVVSLRISGRGEPKRLAQAVKTAFKAAKVSAMPPIGNESVAKEEALFEEMGPRMLQDIREIIGMKGNVVGPMLRFTFPRAERIVEQGTEIPAAMGSGSVISFITGDQDSVATSGTLVLLAKEVALVTRVLRTNDIEITALNNCFLNEQPRLFCMRFWASGDTTALATGLRTALDKMNVKRR